MLDLDEFVSNTDLTGQVGVEDSTYFHVDAVCNNCNAIGTVTFGAIEADLDGGEEPNTVTRGDLALSFVELGEGLSGDYDSEDPDDIDQLRVDVMERQDDGSWEQVNDSSNYSLCTSLPTSMTTDERREALTMMMDVMFPFYQKGDESGAIKHSLARFTWMDYDTFKNRHLRADFMQDLINENERLKQALNDSSHS